MRRVKDVLLNTLDQVGILRLAQIPFHETGNHLIVLAYHRVAPEDSPLSNSLYDLVCASPRKFNEQMQLISTNFNPVSAEDVLNAFNGGKKLPPQSVLVTVDDGYRDFKDTIFPITQKYKIRPVLFVPTAFIGGGVFWWDRLYNAITHANTQQVDTPLGSFLLQDKTSRDIAIETLADYIRFNPFDSASKEIEQICDQIVPEANRSVSYTLDWDDLRYLSSQGATIASHTHTHPILTHISNDRVKDEIRVSLDLIRQQVGEALPIFAYPDGREHAISSDLSMLLEKEGIQIAFTMSDRMSRLKQDNPLLFPRLIPYSSISHAQFHLKLTAIRSIRN